MGQVDAQRISEHASLTIETDAKQEQAILDGIIPNEYDAAREYLLKIKDEILASNPLTEREMKRYLK